MNQRLVKGSDELIKWLVMLGFLTLPYTHFNFMPDLGLTRPVSAIFFALAFGVVGLQAAVSNRFSLRAWLNWPRSWNNWPILRWWLFLIGLGIISALITPFYGLPKEAFTRLLGYVAIFTTLFMAAYSLPRFGIKTLARWIGLGYLPVMVYAVVEISAVLGLQPSIQFILWFRAAFLVPFSWGYRLSLLATEPSFAGYQALLLALILPYIPQKWLRWCCLGLVLAVLVFTLSGTIIGLAALYLGLWFLFSLKRSQLARLTLAASGAGGLTLLVLFFVSPIQQAVNNITNRLFTLERLKGMSISFQIRFHYLLNLVYAIEDSHGLGLGIGQYGYFWKDIYLRHIDYRKFDLYGEVNRALTVPGDYMKPWSVILGIGADLGVAGLALLIAFFYQVYRQLAGPRHKAMFFACLVALGGAYPIVTPHLWLALAFMAGLGAAAKAGGVQA